MKCEFCDEEATVHLKQVLKEEVLEMHLCERCAEERGITDPAGFSLQNLLGGEDTKIELERAINSIKEKLQESIEAEDFEGAAKLRDEVAKMESEGKENAK